MLLTPVADSELPALADFVNAAYRGATAEPAWTSEASYITGQRTDARMLRADLLASPGSCLLAMRDEGDGALLGCVWLEPGGGELWKLGMLTVRPDLQAGGIGRRLLEQAEAYAAQRGALRLRITVVHIRDSLIGWYERRGFVRTGETEIFPYGDDRFGAPLRDDLMFIVMEKALQALASRPSGKLSA